MAWVAFARFSLAGKRSSMSLPRPNRLEVEARIPLTASESSCSWAKRCHQARSLHGWVCVRIHWLRWHHKTLIQEFKNSPDMDLGGSNAGELRYARQPRT